jgi:sugar phosphate isomerase/epimerase
MSGFAVSNIAWPFEQRRAAYRLLTERGITGLEIAPGLLFADAADAFTPPPALVSERLAEIEDAGLTLVSMQSLLFATRNAALFGSVEQRTNFVAGVQKAIDLAAVLAIPHLVLGSPRERAIPEGMSESEAAHIADEAMVDLAAYATSRACRIGLEPNPAIYDTNFATTTPAAINIVRRVNQSGMMLTLDIGGMLANEELCAMHDILNEHMDLVGHVHVSEPFLAPAPADEATAAFVLQSLGALGYSKWISVEMRSTGEDWDQNLRKALDRLNAARSVI